jgi:hypothetical protein
MTHWRSSKPLGLIVAATLVAVAGANTASATVLVNTSGNMKGRYVYSKRRNPDDHLRP